MRVLQGKEEHAATILWIDSEGDIVLLAVSSSKVVDGIGGAAAGNSTRFIGWKIVDASLPFALVDDFCTGRSSSASGWQWKTKQLS